MSTLKKKCDQCDRTATHHSVEIKQGVKIERHLCDQHAAEAGMTSGAVSGHTPINELLSTFVKMHSGAAATQELTCETCGMTFSQFREHSLLGCPQCYAAFEPQLSPLIERAHEGGTHHMGKVPRRAGPGEQRQADLLRLRKRLTEAVAAEDYELAAKLRDELRKFEEQPQ